MRLLRKFIRQIFEAYASLDEVWIETAGKHDTRFTIKAGPDKQAAYPNLGQPAGGKKIAALSWDWRQGEFASHTLKTVIQTIIDAGGDPSTVVNFNKPQGKGDTSAFMNALTNVEVGDIYTVGKTLFPTALYQYSWTINELMGFIQALQSQFL